MTKSTQRARHASKPKSATRQPKNKKRTSGLGKAGKCPSPEMQVAEVSRGKKVTGEIPSEKLPLSKIKADHRATDVTPDEFFKAWSRKDREALIEVLIDTLDAEAGDPDLEETGDDEPSLGFLDGDIHVGRGCQYIASTDDRELEDELDEPSLAAAENHVSTPETYGWAPSGVTYSPSGDQSCWAQGAINDAEGDEHDGREPDDDEGGEAEKEDDEPSLGWTAQEAAFGTYVEINGCCDLEEQCEDEGDLSDSGVADTDGLLEQCAGLHLCGYGTSGFARAAI